MACSRLRAGGSRSMACASKDLLSLLGILAIILLAHPGSAFAQVPGFISVDCGASTGYTDPGTTIVYEPDNYISTGSTATVTPTQRTNPDVHFNTLRYFPADTTPKKNCYTLNVDVNTQYLVRALFYHGNYVAPPPSGLVSFELALDASFWTEVRVQPTPFRYIAKEAIVMTTRATLSFCLIRTSDGIEGVPFINTLELRPISSSMYLGHYNTPSQYFLNNLDRRDFGQSTQDIRYPKDEYDRLWFPYNATSLGFPYTDLSAPDTAVITPFPVGNFVYDTVPNSVLQTAMTDVTLINYTSFFDATVYKQLYVSIIIAEVLEAGGSRIIDLSGSFFDPTSLPISVIPLQYIQLRSTGVSGTNGYINFQVRKNSTSVLGPIVNAFELLSVQDVAPGTDATQAAALADIKAELKRDVWSGDPCLPEPWVGLNCSTDGKVTSIDLSNQRFTGLIPDFSALTTLVSLNLSDNGFTGPLPGWVAGLSSLRTLDVSDNQLTGTFPSSYISRIPGFRYSNNLQLTCVPADNVACPASPPSQPLTPSTPRGLNPPSPPPPTATVASKSKKSSAGPIIGAVVGVILLLALIVGAALLYFFCYKKRKGSNVKIPQAQSPMNISLAAPSTVGTPLHVTAMRGKAQPFTLQSIKEATNNFARKLGEGGFGPVYYGMLKPQREVAVKVMSGKTQQGFSEFSNEIDLLSTVHYKKLVSLVGYCQEGSDLILLYEYMSGGDLRQRLYGSNASHSPLNWRQRLHIALDAARGLEYLHYGCSPAIFHRDVKSSNILLTEKLEAKVADFGLSKLTDAEQTHVMTMVKGTLGYLDPEYNTTGMLTDKSDVYSFGVVLLELLLGQPPIAREGGHSKFIVDKVRTAMNTGSLQTVMDPRLRGDYKAESAWRLAEVAMSCVSVSGGSRPAMSKVVAELAQVLEIEFGGQQDSTRDGVSGDSDLFTSNISSGPAPHNNSNYGNYSNNYNSRYSDASSLPPEPPSQIFHQDVRPYAR